MRDRPEDHSAAILVGHGALSGFLFGRSNLAIRATNPHPVDNRRRLSGAFRYMITDKTVKKLGDALVELNCHYDADDYRKILDYALANWKVLAYPHAIADMLVGFAKELRKFPDKRDPAVERWKLTRRKDVRKPQL